MRARFWRNVTLIALAHVALLVVLLHWAGATKAASAEEITWMSGGAETEASEAAERPEPTASASAPERADTTAPAESEIVLPSPTATPSAIPRPTPTPKVKPTAAPKAIAKKKTTPKSSPTPAKKKVAVSPGKKEGVAKTGGRKKPVAGNAKTSTGGSGEGTSGTGSGKSDAATVNYYASMLHDRFYHAWEQPQTVVASGVKLSAVARIRIEKDGRVSDFKVVKPCGNVLVDESIQAVSKRVTQVDALPAGIGSGGHYDVNINFALNPE